MPASKEMPRVRNRRGKLLRMISALDKSCTPLKGTRLPTNIRCRTLCHCESVNNFAALKSTEREVKVLREGRPRATEGGPKKARYDCTLTSIGIAFTPLQGSNGSGYYTAQGDDPRRNVLSLGCRVADPHATSELLSVQGVACAFPNTTVNVIRSPPWELLLSRIGDDLMFALLRQHALLHRLPNRCFMQVTYS